MIPVREPFKCRCGRTTHKPEVWKGQMLCAECAFDEEYGIYRPGPSRRDAREYVRPTFTVRRVT